MGQSLPAGRADQDTGHTLSCLGPSTVRANDLHGLLLEMAELHEQSVLTAAAKFLSVLTYISTLRRGGNLTLFHPAITSNTAPIERMKHPDVTAMGSPSLTATQEHIAPSPQ